RRRRLQRALTARRWPVAITHTRLAIEGARETARAFGGRRDRTLDSLTHRRRHTMYSKLLLALFTLALGAGAAMPAWAQEVLPFPAKPSGSVAGRTMQESIYSPLPAVSHLPKDAPNILIVLIDDVGPAQADTYGGEIHTPTLSKIAKEGISYNRFHTTAMCSPTRAALLTGRNQHRVASGQITELANDWDGYSGTIPKSSATVAEVLK